MKNSNKKRSAQASFDTIQEKELQLAKAFLSKRCKYLEELGEGSYIPSSIDLFESIAEGESICIKPYSGLLHRMQQEATKKDLPTYMMQAERLILALAVMHYIMPSGWRPVVALAKTENWGFMLNQTNPHQFIPTKETILLLLAGDDFKFRQQLLEVFSLDHVLFREGVLELLHEPSSAIKLSEEYINLLIKGKPYRPDFISGFAAQQVVVQEEWEDLILHEETDRALEDITIWLAQRKNLAADKLVNKRIKKGYRALFYGPSGTGKTMSAGLIGKKAGVPVYKIDLSAVISKYVGETEKNLEAIFQKAEHRDWILFFDEADALFGKRSQTQSANDRFANQEVAYLLQRIENYDGLVILSSNLKSNMDEAFTRRFQVMVKFSTPDDMMRRELFSNVFDGRYKLQQPEMIAQVCNKKYNFTAAEINNIFRYCAMRVLHQDMEGTSEAIFHNAVVSELKKKGKAL